MTERFYLSNISPEIVAVESRRVQEILTSLVPANYVYEVGSTAVPGIIGKQDLDFLVRPPDSAFSAVRSVLDQALQRDPKQLSNAVYQGYLVESTLDVAVQLTVANGPNDTFLEFLNRLRTQPELVERYNALKREFDGQDMEDYRQAKQAFIHNVLLDAPS